MNPKIWIDADSCPTLVRNHVVDYAGRLNIIVSFVANKEIPASNPNFRMIITDNTKDAADNYIVENVESNDLVITRDILLAARLVDKKITVINDRGTSFTSSNIKDRLSDRDFDLQLAEIGLGGSKKNSYSRKELKKFCDCFDKEIQKLIRKATLGY